MDLHGSFVRRMDFTEGGRARKRVAVSRDEGELPDAEQAKPAASLATEAVASEDIPTQKSPCTPTKKATRNVSATPSPSPKEGLPTIIITTPTRSNTRRKSPPLHSSFEDSPLTWHDSEITGHNPTDPNDDGYGINGVGFRPTAAIAWARSQKRKQQVADYRTREAREARARRNERRRNGSNSGTASPQESPKALKKGRVRFDGPIEEIKDTAL